MLQCLRRLKTKFTRLDIQHEMDDSLFELSDETDETNKVWGGSKTQKGGNLTSPLDKQGKW